MSPRAPAFLGGIGELAETLRRLGGVLSGEAAAHVHLAAATGTRAGGAAGYGALPPRRIRAIVPAGADAAGVEPDRGAVAEVLRARLDLFGTTVVLPDGERVPVLRREAVIAQLLAQGGLALGLTGVILAITGPIDADEVREILKAARQGDRFQPLLELLDVV